MGNDRKQAVEAGAVSLSSLLAKAGLSPLFNQLTAAQVQLLQNYLDAAAVDASIETETADLRNKGATNQDGNGTANPEAQRKIDRLRRDYVPISRLDDATRLNISKILDPKALSPITDNPDEAAYLKSVRAWLDDKGVWLRLDRVLVRDPDDPSQWIYDGKRFNVWLSFGPHGDAIPTKTGLIDRQALMATGVIGALYWKYVESGPILSWLQRNDKLVSMYIEDGLATQREMARNRTETMLPGVAQIADKIGGANFPDFSIWDAPIQLSAKSSEMKNKGRTWGALLLMLAAIGMVRVNYDMLTAYTEKTVAGAAVALKIAKVTAAVSAIVFVGLALLPAVAAGGAAGAAGASGGAVGAAGAGATSVEAQLGANMARYLGQYPEFARELAQVRVAPGMVRNAAGWLLHQI